MRLSIALVLVSLAAAAERPHGPPGQHGPPGGGPGPMMGREMTPEDQKAIHDYKLTTSNTGKLMDAHKRLREWHEKNPEAMKGENPMAARTIDDSVKRVEAAPAAAKAILKDAGLAPREFVVGTFAMMTSAMWHSMKKMAPQASPPEYVNPDNLKFIDAHPELMEKFKNMGPRHHGGEEHDGD